MERTSTNRFPRTIMLQTIEKSIELARELFPQYYQARRCIHFAFIYKRNTLLSIGINDYRPSGRAVKLARQFNLSEENKSLHAEMDAVQKLLGRYHIDRSLKLISLRLNRHGEIKNARPCNRCTKIINAFGMRVWYSSSEGKILSF